MMLLVFTPPLVIRVESQNIMHRCSSSKFQEIPSNEMIGLLGGNLRSTVKQTSIYSSWPGKHLLEHRMPSEPSPWCSSTAKEGLCSSREREDPPNVQHDITIKGTVLSEKTTHFPSNKHLGFLKYPCLRSSLVV